MALNTEYLKSAQGILKILEFGHRTYFGLVCLAFAAYPEPSTRAKGTSLSSGGQEHVKSSETRFFLPILRTFCPIFITILLVFCTKTYHIYNIINIKITICIAFPCLVDYELKQTVVFGERLIPRAWFFFFVAVFVIGLLAVLLIFSVLAFSLTEKNLNFVLYIFSFLLALLFLVASVRMADFMKKEYELAKIHKAFGFHGHSDIITVSVSFSLVSTFLLAVDVYLFYRKRKSGSANEARGQTEV